MKLRMILIVSVLALFITSCGVNQPAQPVEEVKSRCWDKVYNPELGLGEFMIIVNVCDGPNGGEVRTTVIKPIKDHLDPIRKRLARILAEERAHKRSKNLF